MSGFDETFDFVVVGAGGGSMCAALLLRSVGKSVLILEKTEFVGGTTARSGGIMWIPNNVFMQRDGVEDSYEQAMTYLDNVVGDHHDTPGASRERRRAYVVEAPRMVDFLMQQGIKLYRPPSWPDYYDERPGGSQAGRTVAAEPFDLNELGPWRERLQPGWLNYPARLEEAMAVTTAKRSWAGKKMVMKMAFRVIAAKLRGRRWASAGVGLQGRMLQAALRQEVDIRTDAPVTELIEDNGAVVGVVTSRDGRPWRVAARLGVLVNAGGFARNQRMRDLYQPGTRAEWSSVTKGDTGEMIEEMMRHGAAIAQMDAMVGYQTSIPPGHENDMVLPSILQVTAAPHVILVDQSGVRYMNEGGSYELYCRTMLERNRTVPAVPSWAIFDTAFLKNYMLNGTNPGVNKPASWIESGYMKKAATIEDLARQLSIEPATLQATVARFNDFAAKGHDDDFNRGDRAYDRWLGQGNDQPSATLGPIDQGPFHAIPVYPGDVGTFGGVVTDAQARVLRADGSVIQGLYATGISTASVMGRSYPGAGSSVGPSFVWGYVAAKHAAGADNVV